MDLPSLIQPIVDDPALANTCMDKTLTGTELTHVTAVNVNGTTLEEGSTMCVCLNYSPLIIVCMVSAERVGVPVTFGVPARMRLSNDTRYSGTPSIPDTLGTSTLWGPLDYGDVFTSEVEPKRHFGTFACVLNSGVSSSTAKGYTVCSSCSSNLSALFCLEYILLALITHTSATHNTGRWAS